MSAHTPGPWFVFGNGHCVGGAASDGDQGTPTAGIAMCGMTRRQPAEVVANARLISSAPDLLAELQRVYDSLGGECFDWGPVRAAIAKATGGAA